MLHRPTKWSTDPSAHMRTIAWLDRLDYGAAQEQTPLVASGEAK
jgi:hypothetical protein